MENKDKEYMRFIAACFALINNNPQHSVRVADELLAELEKDDSPAGGIVDIVPKRKRTRST